MKGDKYDRVKGAVSGIENVSENRRMNNLNGDRNRLEEDWNRRVKQLGIDLNSAIRVKYYQEYYENKNTKSYSYVYLWAAEGLLQACKQSTTLMITANRYALFAPRWNGRLFILN